MWWPTTHVLRTQVGYKVSYATLMGTIELARPNTSATSASDFVPKNDLQSV